MKSFILTLALLICAPACVASTVEPQTEEAVSTITTAEDEAPEDDGAVRVDTTPVLAPAYAEPGSCVSCGPGPQPWHGAVWIRPGR